jgi:hypothetical protein
MQKQRGNPYARAAIMEVVENQIRDNDPPQTAQTFQRLMAADHSEREAKRLIGCVVSAEIYDVLKKKGAFKSRTLRKRSRQTSRDALGRKGRLIWSRPSACRV